MNEGTNRFRSWMKTKKNDWGPNTWLFLAGNQVAGPGIQGRGGSCCWLLGEGALQVRYMIRANIGKQQILEQNIYLDALPRSSLLLESRAVAAGCMQSVAPSDRCSVRLKQVAGSRGRWVGRRAGQALDKGNGKVSSSCALAGVQWRSSASCEQEEGNGQVGASAHMDCGTGGREEMADLAQRHCPRNSLPAPHH